MFRTRSAASVQFNLPRPPYDVGVAQCRGYDAGDMKHGLGRRCESRSRTAIGSFAVFAGRAFLCAAVALPTACEESAPFVEDDAGVTVDGPDIGFAPMPDTGVPAPDLGFVPIDAGPCQTNEDCDDGLFCNGVEICFANACQAGPSVDCTDIDACTTDVCDEAERACTNTFDPTCTVCSVDAFEPNDTFATAVLTGAGTYGGLYACVNNEDWHTFTLGNNELIDVLIAFEDAIGDINISIYDEAGTPLVSQNSATDDERLVFTTPAAGTYALLVDFNDFAGDDDDIPGNRYAMTLGLGEPCTDPFEDNDTRSDATPVSSGIVSGARGCPYDDDWYRVSVQQEQLILVTADFIDADGDLNLQLYDSSGSLVAASFSSSDGEAIAYTAFEAGDFFIRATLIPAVDDASAGVAYTLDIDLDQQCTDAFESNDSRLDAAVVTDGTYALNACPLDSDWYRISASDNQVIQLNAEFVNARGNVNMRLYDASGGQLSAALSSTNDEAIVWTAPYDGDYFVQVDLAGPDDALPGNDYTLRIDTATPCVDPFENNDLRATAYPLGAGTFSGLRVCPGDDDWYRLTIPNAGPFTVDASFAHDEGNINLVLVDPSGDVVAQALSSSDNESLAVEIATPGEYFVRVTLGQDTGDQAGNEYDLAISGATLCSPTTCASAGATCGPLADGCGGTLDCGACPGGTCSPNNRCDCVPTTCASANLDCGIADDGCGRPLNCGECTANEICEGAYEANVCAVAACAEDRFEDNDARTEPVALAVDQTVDGLTVCPGDADFFSFSAQANQAVTATARFVDAEGNVDLRLYSPDGDQVALALGGTDVERLVHTTATPGDYVLGVFQGAADDRRPGSAYALTISTEACDDAFEDNDQRLEGTTLLPGSYGGLRACPGDTDWYRVSINANEVLDVTARFADALGNIAMRLYDDTGAVVSQALSGSDDERIVYAAPTGGDYFIQVVLGTPDDSVPGNVYGLDVVVDTSCTDPFEDNDDRATATRFPNGTASDLTSCPSDDDWYRIDVLDNRIVEIDATFVHADGNINLTLTDGSGDPVSSALSGNDNERIVYTAQSDDALALRVFLQNDPAPPGNVYALSVSSSVPCTDTFENNDSSSRAHRLGAGTYADLTACPADQDWYAVDAEEGAELDIELEFSNATGNINLQLYDPKGAPIASALSGTDDERMTYTVPVTGTYAFVVTLASDDDTPGNAYSMRIAGAAPCASTTTCEGVGAECGTILDGCGVPVDCGSCPSGQTCSVTNICSCVPADCGATGLQCGVAEDGCGGVLDCGPCAGDDVCGGAYQANTCDAPACIEDALEDNDTRQTAPETPDGVYRDLTVCADDVDWYELDLANDTVIRSRFLFDDAKGDIAMRLLNASGTQLDLSLSGTDDEYIAYTTPAAGTYFIQATIGLRDDEVPGNRYDWVLDTTQVCTDAFEDNDRVEEAISLISGTYPGLTSCPNDDDWFEMALGNNELIEVDVSFFDALGDINIRLSDDTGTQLVSSLSSGDSERIVYTTGSSGVYRLAVRFAEGSGDDETAGNDYQLDLDVGVPCTDAFEDSDTRLTAQNLPFGLTENLTSCPFDQDWYRIEIAGDRRLLIEASFTHVEGNINLALFDPAGNAIVSALSGTDNETIDYRTPDTGPYFLRVTIANDDAVPGNTYSLQLTDAP